MTLGLTMAALGCASSHESDEEDAGDDAIVVVDAGTDAGPDAGVDCTDMDWWDTEECCEMFGGFWSEGGCGVPGPFVPPSMPG